MFLYNLVKVSLQSVLVQFDRVLVNSRFEVLNSNFLSLSPTFYKVSIEKYSKTPFLEDSLFTPIFKILARTL